MKVLFICGGSGGHIFPCVALAEYFSTKGIRSFFLVSEKIVDIKIMESFPYPYTTVSKISSKIDYITFLYKHKKNIWGLLKFLDPTVVIATGSIYSFIPVLEVLKKSKKVFLFEPNTIAGRVNSFLFRFCAKVFTGWKGDYSTSFFGKKAINSGIPIRRLIKAHYDKMEVLKQLNLTQDKKTVLIIGGSQGSKFLNNTIPGLLINSELKDKIQIVILSSDRFPDENFNCDNVRILPFTVDVGKFYSIADLAITRSGAITLSEICYRKIPNISIPYQNSTNNHQLINSKFLQEKGATFCIEENEFSGNYFIQLCKKLLFDDNLISNMKMSMQGIFVDNAENTIYQHILKSKRISI